MNEMDVVTTLIKSGPGFVLAGVMLWLYVGSKTTYTALVERLLIIIKETVTSDNQHRATLEETRTAISSLDTRMGSMEVRMGTIERRLEELTAEIRRNTDYRNADYTGPIRRDDR